MPVSREDSLGLVLTASFLAAGFALGGPVAAVAAGVGGNWAADLGWRAWTASCSRLFGQSTPLNHDLRQTAARALQQAVEHVRDSWWSSPAGVQQRHDARISTGGQRAEQRATETFKRLRELALSLLDNESLWLASDNVVLSNLLDASQSELQATLEQQLMASLGENAPHVAAFIRERLPVELGFFFGEELKADRPANNRAWRAFQRLLLEGMQQTLADLQAGQDQIVQALSELKRWSERMETRGLEEREITGQHELEEALIGVRNQLTDIIMRESSHTRVEIGLARDQLLAELASFREEWRQVRQRPTNEPSLLNAEHPLAELPLETIPAPAPLPPNSRMLLSPNTATLILGHVCLLAASAHRPRCATSPRLPTRPGCSGAGESAIAAR